MSMPFRPPLKPQPGNTLSQAKQVKPPAAPPVYRPQPARGALQSKAAAGQRPPVAVTRQTPAAPPAYRPQPTPRVLQAKASTVQKPLNQPRPSTQIPATQPPRPNFGVRPHTLPGAQGTKALRGPSPKPPSPPRAVPSAPAAARAAIQPKVSRPAARPPAAARPTPPGLAARGVVQPMTVSKPKKWWLDNFRTNNPGQGFVSVVGYPHITVLSKDVICNSSTGKYNVEYWDVTFTKFHYSQSKDDSSRHSFTEKNNTWKIDDRGGMREDRATLAAKLFLNRFGAELDTDSCWEDERVWKKNPSVKTESESISNSSNNNNSVVLDEKKELLPINNTSQVSLTPTQVDTPTQQVNSNTQQTVHTPNLNLPQQESSLWSYAKQTMLFGGLFALHMLGGSLMLKRSTRAQPPDMRDRKKRLP